MKETINRIRASSGATKKRRFARIRSERSGLAKKLWSDSSYDSSGKVFSFLTVDRTLLGR